MSISVQNGAKDLYIGLIYIVVGAAAFWGAHNYDMGTLLQMGPGYFPALIGALLVVLGVCCIIVGLRKRRPDPIVHVGIEPILRIVTGVFSFTFLVDWAGLVVAIAALIFFACFRRLVTNPLEVLVTYLVLTIFSALVFIDAFGMPIPLVWWIR
jgi:hypothetical protein